MASQINEQVARLVVQTAGQQGVDDLKNKVDLVKIALDNVSQAYDTGAIDVTEYTTRVAALSAEEARFTEVLQVAETLLARQKAGLSGLGDSAEQARSKLNGMNSALRNVGFGLNDLLSNNGPLGQRIMGFANNVGQAVQGAAQWMGVLGPKAIIAGQAIEFAFTATGATLQALGIKNVDDLVNYFKGGVDKATGSLSVLENRIKELTAKPHLIPVEVLELANARKEVERIEASLKAVENLKKTQEHYEQESGKAAANVIANASDERGNHIGAEAATNMMRQVVVKDIFAKVNQESAAEQAKIQAEVDSLAAIPASSDPESGFHGALLEAQARLEAAKQRQTERQTAITTGRTDNGVFTPALADQVLGDAVTDMEKAQGKKQAAGREKVAGYADRAGLKGVAGGIRASSPEDLLAIDQAEEDLEESIKEMKERREKREAANKLEEQRKDALEEVRTQFVINGKTQEQADAIVAVMAKDRLKDIKDELDKLKEDLARKKAITKYAQELREAGKTPEQIKEAVAVAQDKPHQLTEAQAANLNVETKRQRALAENKEAGGTAKPDDTPEQIQQDTKKAKEKKAAEKKDDKAEDKLKNKTAADLEHTFDQDWQPQYEANVAANQARILNGAPVARSEAQEKRLRQSGQEYALPPEVLQKRQQQSMYESMVRQKADPEAAHQAVQAITDKGDRDLMARMNNTANGGLQANVAAYNVAVQLNAEVQQLAQKQNFMQQQWARLQRDAAARQRTLLPRGNR